MAQQEQYTSSLSRNPDGGGIALAFREPHCWHRLCCGCGAVLAWAGALWL